ncbi:MAG: membrane dipeptidase [bacterium]|nr:membrane dipeptidase [bacterium]
MKKYNIIDGHQDIAFNSIHMTNKDFLTKSMFSESKLSDNPKLNQSDYIRLINSDVKIVFGVTFPYKTQGESVYTDQNFAKEETQKQLDFYNFLDKRSEGRIKVIKSKIDLEFVLKTDNVLGLVMLLEDAMGVDVELSNLEQLYKQGIRVVGVTWNTDNQFGGGTDSDHGITEAGVKLLRKMDTLGMILDTAHMNKTLFYDALQIFKGPIINSHTCTFTLNPHRRNLEDGQLKVIAGRGGVVGIAFVPEFLNKSLMEASLQDVVAHIQHAVSVCGIDHVGFGSDFDGMSWPEYVLNLKDTSEYGNLISELEKIYSEEEITKIAFSNWKNFLLKSI